MRPAVSVHKLMVAGEGLVLWEVFGNNTLADWFPEVGRTT